MSNARGKEIDNTHLSIDLAERRGFIHRDYIAHCLRWSHVAKYLSAKQLYKTADILDIGCGKDLPLLRMLYSSRLIPDTGSYTGVDVNTLEAPFNLGRFPHELVGNTDVCEWDDGGSTFAVITSFEVLEHVEPAHTLAILQRIRSLLEDDGVAFISTPVYDADTGAAANHVNEMSYKGLEFLIKYAGLKIDQVNGTFASIKDYKDQIDKDGLTPVFDRLREYYDTNYLSTIFAPLYPRLSRNCIWRLSKSFDLAVHMANGDLAAEKHSSSEKWGSFILSLLDKENK
jgi:hypothetical protein